MLKAFGFAAALAAWLFLCTYALLAVTMGGCAATEPGCDPSHVGGIATVGVAGALGFAAIVWWFFLRRTRRA